MGKRWINCTELMKYHDVLPAESVQAITNGRIDAYSSQLRKIVNVRHYELKKNTRDAILSELDILEQETCKRPLVSFAPDATHVGEFLGAGAEKLIKNRWENNIPTYYIIHPHETLPINFGWLESILQNPSRKVQCKELSFIQFKYEDAVRCFGLTPVEDAPAPVTEVQSVPVVEASTNETATVPTTAEVDTPKALIARLRGDGINDPYQLAPLVKENFPSQSDADIGELFPANPGRVVGWSAKNARGRRLLGKK